MYLLFAVAMLTFLTHNLAAQYSTLYNFLTHDDNNMRNPFISEPVVNGTALFGMTPNGGNNNGGVIFRMNTDGTNWQKLHNFSKPTGISPYGSLTLTEDSLCGMTYEGGASDAGVIFKINVNGSGYRCIHQFSSGNPRGNLLQLGDSLFGMTSRGGANARGSIFKIHKNGKGFKEFFSFPGANGSAPYSSLTLVGDSLYGTTLYGGVNNQGVIFKIHRNGTGYKKIFDFSSTNGSYPLVSLTLSGDSLYGMTESGGANDLGVIFRIHKNSSGFKKLLDFSSATGGKPNGSLTLVGDSLYGMNQANGVVFKIHKGGNGYQKLVIFNGAEKGSTPRGSLTLSGTTLYGMTQYGGATNNGVIFKIEKDGTGFTKLKDCYDVPNGASPNSIITDGPFIYGTTYEGGAKGYGTVYKTKIDGSGFQQLYSFDQTNGYLPRGTMLLLGDSLYGTASAGGGNGTIFRIHVNGSGFKRIYNFNYTNGSTPYSSPILLGDSLYGTTYNGGSANYGVIYKIHKNGSGYKSILNFNNSNGGSPYGSLTQIGDSLYGMTRNGGSASLGVIFKIHRSGTGFQKLHDFTTSTGIVPEGSLTLVGDSLYGMTAASNKNGVIFKIHRKGTGYTVMHDFETTDGISPRGSLTLLGNDLYGLTSSGGDDNYGTLFKINIKTGVFTKLRDLKVSTGANPQGSLFAFNNVLYGACNSGGASGLGVVFKYKPVTVQASGIQFPEKLATQVNITLTAGDGASRAIFMCQGSSGTPVLANKTAYTPNSVFGLGSQAGAGWYCVANGTATSFTVTGLTANTTYRAMAIEYIGYNGEEFYLTSTASGNPSNCTTIGKLAQTITFGTLPIKVYGNVDFNPGATVSSGLNITYTSSNPAVANIVNGKIHITGVGSSIITATQPGNSNYYAAISVDQALFVNKADQTITFPDLPVKTPVDADFSPGATASSGLSIAYTSSNTSVATIVGNKIHIIGTGTSEITASQTGTLNYNAAPNVSKTLIVKLAQTINFPAISTKAFGNADFDPGATATSGLPVTYTSSNTSVATISNGLIHIVGAGTSTITASQAGNGNYQVATSIEQILSVTKANQTITFPNFPEKTTGDANFSPGATASSGLPITYSSSNTSVATIVDNKINIVGAGTSVITASQSGNNNYNAASNVVKTLTVKSTQTINFPTIPVKTTGSADFNPGATATSGLPVTYISSNTNVATITGGMIHIVGAGTANITASQPGNTSYIAAPDVVQTLTVNQATAIGELSNNEILVYPVPATNKLSVKIPENSNALVQVVNIMGQIVISKKQTTTLEVINVSALSKGVYTLKVIVDEKMIIKKVEIQ